ncbi:MAG: hypothetical protein UR31_C0007G0017 [Parcubacteria group bacterium GW2011_GWA2_33_14]|uniref:Uncharacterized protein n=1 Tax=Candidatus Staskawiczbacteria bacterium RIFCSPHIGHO2_02_FULL_33_16 TaxID=1802204 RepID=A0A1G2HYE1_9BACT|nr:MAG: hypothetical protein UR31_C0007G0017 [Parcubacteria group bacterium GW2011_GWA2_33_14]OGZ67477.1 MAG: hypothetical protein A3D34_01155 [Candidatus Staskawiczbacteria bacterium RIFCSPHIGHO2_02_FULL_33_16]OGZ70991.1 MAG: hypothetical protein A2980_03220 [Candidatus Staskawiczbacteria bacterium RIFCSPLOWO2_01_FULL_33_13]
MNERGVRFGVFENKFENNIFTLEGKENKLPGDLVNAFASIYGYFFDFYQEGTITGEVMKDMLKNAKKFEEYFTEKLENHNIFRKKNGWVLCDKKDSMEVEIKKIGRNLIEEFDGKIDELIKCGDDEKLDIGKIELILKGLQNLF